MPNKTPVYRFAPSPNGELHLGHAFSAILNFELAKRSGGRFLLRIEDIDQARSTPEFIDAITRDLKWLGLEWEEPVRVQSHHMGTYRAALTKLEELGLLYPCFASRKEIAAAVSKPANPPLDPDGALVYPGIFRNTSKDEIESRRTNGEPFALRLDMTRAIETLNSHKQWPLSYIEVNPSGAHQRITCDPTRWGDIVIARKDLHTSYHLSVVVDDAIQKITHVTRGLDLQAATDIHRVLQAFLDLPEPIYHHHKLITDKDGQKLSKSISSTSLRALRDDGTTPEQIWASFGLIK